MHGVVSLLVCLFGSVANGLNIAVLTRREMSSPTNAILTGLAVADLLVMVEYIPFALHHYLLQQPLSEKFSYPWSVFVLFHSNFGQVFHTISIWLTLTLAVWRYIAVAHPARNHEWCNMRTTGIAIVSGYVICPLLCIPAYLTFSVQASKVDPETNRTLYVVGHSELSKLQDGMLQNINFWAAAWLVKVLPAAPSARRGSAAVSLVSTGSPRRRRCYRPVLPGPPPGPPRPCPARLCPSQRLVEKEKQTDRTTKMLLAVLLLFLITEAPQGLLGLFSVLIGNQFFGECYVKLGDVMDILALINSAINFMVYCCMSRQFRNTFNQLFRPRLLNAWTMVPQHNGHEDGNGHTVGVTMTQVTNV
ncbi:hypothetical protein ONE63_000953 [Megalurothrips usitatus]|uniref:G-protein coupled receptors family 1 profile domain-containing protein n=1 Tax=Megalurothrips usitatus TaxID=439358 RepID=A0AAV7Y052_9NEOP|nr:hypothetical protein ONE63_000953 [Megalurothrips usitatus]